MRQRAEQGDEHGSKEPAQQKDKSTGFKTHQDRRGQKHGSKDPPLHEARRELLLERA